MTRNRRRTGDRASSVTSVEDASAEMLAGHQICVRFDGLVALDGVDIFLRRGELMGLIGPNGAGKSTLINVLSGFQSVHAGQVLLSGMDVTRLRHRHRARQGMARTFQGVRIFPWMTAVDNVAVGAVAMGERRSTAQKWAWEILHQAGLGNVALAPAGALPFAKQSLISVLRALATRPKFLLLDEPAAGLDDRQIQDLIDIISWIREQNCGILLIEHNLRLVMNVCTRVHALDKGRTLAVGSAEEIKRNPNVIRAYMGDEYTVR